MENKLPEQILDEYRDVVRAIAKSAIRSSATIDLADLISIGNLAVLRAVRGYNPSHGATFTAYVKRCIRRAVYNEAARFLGVFTVDHRTTEAAAEATRMHNAGLTDQDISEHFSRSTTRRYDAEHIFDLRMAYGRRHICASVTENDAECLDTRSIEQLLQDIPQTDIEKSVLSNRILGTSTVQELASILQVSESTIYRTENALRVKIERAIKDG